VGLGRYSWLTNTIDPEEDLARLGIFAAMAGMFVVALGGTAGVRHLRRALRLRLLRRAGAAHRHVRLCLPHGGIRDAVRRMAPGMLIGAGC
jgi:hypothetical protein